MQIANENKICLFMTVERQRRIDANNKRIEELQQELDKDQKYLDSFEKTRTSLYQIDKDIELSESLYRSYNNSDVIGNIGNQIQALANKISEKEEKIRMIEIIMDVYSEKKKITLFSVFSRYYKNRKQVYEEESDEKPDYITEFIHFRPIYNSILEIKNRVVDNNLEFPEQLQNVLSYYKKEKEKLLVMKDNKEEELSKIRRFKRGFPIIQSKLQQQKMKLQRKLATLTPNIKSIMARRRQINSEIMELQRINDGYISQMNKLNETANQKVIRYQTRQQAVGA